MPRLVLGPLLRHVSETTATVWVETDTPCEVQVLGDSTRTFTVGGHHFAIVVCDGLQPGTTTPYDVALDGERVWPEPESPYPPSVVRTLSGQPGEPIKLLFGSCRVARPHEAPYTSRRGKEGVGVDALYAYAVRMQSTPPEEWPEAVLFLGDQVYADELSPKTREHIERTRGFDEPPGEGIANFAEYTVLYEEAWSDPTIRWALSTIPSAMIFDDHDIHDDWNTSATWRRQMQATSWWQDRVTGGLMAYWLYQHLGNLSPTELAENEVLQKLQALDGDGEDLLREFAAMADREADGGRGARWSYRRDLGDVRVLMLDSRGGRALERGERSMVDAREWDWILDNTRDCPAHLVLGTSLPVLLPNAIQHLESWNEALCDGAWGKRWAVWGEKIRQAADLEHWAAFRKSFEALMELIAEVGAGRRGPAPATISILSGDVHFSYLSRPVFAADAGVQSKVTQLVCSPVRNPVQRTIQMVDRFARTEPGVKFGRLLRRSARVPRAGVDWRVDAGPWFDNEIATLDLQGREAQFTLERARLEPDGSTGLEQETTVDLTGAYVS